MLSKQLLSGPLLSRRTVNGLLMAAGASAIPLSRSLALNKHAPFADNLQSLAWWMRRTTGKTIKELMPYYQQVIGLPLQRAWENDLVLLWAGEDQIFEVKTDDNPTRKQPEADSAAMLPVFRVHDLAKWRARMTAHGYEPVSQRQSKWGRTLFYRGPDNLITGFEQRSANSPLGSDQRALKRWNAGQFRLGDLPLLPDSLHYLSRAIRHVTDVKAMSRFYRDAVGFESLGREGDSELFALGKDSVLEIAHGGVAIPEPADRSELPDTYVLRIHDLDAQREGLPKRGVRLKGEMSIKEETTRLVFVPDPEGWIMGIEERGQIRSQYIDDVEAERRWLTEHP